LCAGLGETVIIGCRGKPGGEPGRMPGPFLSSLLHEIRLFVAGRAFFRFAAPFLFVTAFVATPDSHAFLHRFGKRIEDKTPRHIDML
jgi:hypothetical protein